MKTISNVLHEIGNHKAFCATFGITETDLETTPEAAATIAYGSVYYGYRASGYAPVSPWRISNQHNRLVGDSTRLMMALMACLLGYGEVGLWLKKQSTLPDSWVKLDGKSLQTLDGRIRRDMYQGAVRLGLGMSAAKQRETRSWGY